MQLLNLLIVLTIAFLLTTLVSRLFVSKWSINSSFIRRVIRIFSFLLFTFAFSYASTFLPFGSVIYGQRQAKYFYYSNEANLRFIVSQFEKLSKKGLWSIIKQKGERNKIEITINNTSFYHSDLDKRSVDDILRQSEIDKSELNRVIELFKRINIVQVRNSGAGYIMIAIKEVAPYYVVYLNFCIDKNIDCINYNLPAHIETDVYFDRLSNP